MVVTITMVAASLGVGYGLYRFSNPDYYPTMPVAAEPLESPEATWVAKTRLVLPLAPWVILCFVRANTDSLLISLHLTIFCTFLFAIFWFDAAYYETPDWLTVPCFIWAFVASVWALLREGKEGGFMAPEEVFLGACAGTGSVIIFTWLAEAVTGRNCIGFGDATAAGVLGAYLGVTGVWTALIVAVIMGGVIGIPFLMVKYLKKRRDGQKEFTVSHIPFLVLLAPAAVIRFFFPLELSLLSREWQTWLWK